MLRTSSVNPLTGVTDEEVDATIAADETRIAWLKRIRDRRTALESSRMHALKKTFDAIVAEDLAKLMEKRKRVIITSGGTRVLDIPSIILEDSPLF